MPGVRTLVRETFARLNGEPRAAQRLHAEGTLPHQGIHDPSDERDIDIASRSRHRLG